MAAPCDTNDRYILMKDTQGERSVSSIVSAIKKPFGGGNSVRQIIVLRGELLGQIHPSQQQVRSDGLAHNYFVDRDPSTTLFVVDEQGISPLFLEEYQLLRGIDSCFDRFNVFVNGDWLEWGVKLNVGNQVYVRLPGPNASTADWSLAVIRYKGKVKSLHGTNFGVEICDKLHRTKGSSDGSFQEYQYFECEQNCGMFVSLERILSQHPRGTPSDHQSQRQYTPTTANDNKQSYARVLSKPQPSSVGRDTGTEVDPPSSKAQSAYKVNDRVVIFDKNDIALHGVVKWTGRKRRLGDGKVIHVGIEMNTRVNPTEVPGAKAGIIDWFAAKKNQTIVIPESLVITEDSYVDSGMKKPQRLVAHAQVVPPLNVDDPVALARDYGMTKREFMAEQQQILKEAEKQKKKQDKDMASQNRDAEEIKLALGESVNIAAQKQLFADIRKRAQEEGSGSQGQQQHLHPDQSSLDRGGVKRQHSWQPGTHHIYETMPGERGADKHRHIGAQGKSSSMAEGDRIAQSFYREGQGQEHYRANDPRLGKIPGPPGSENPPQQQEYNYPYHQEQIHEHENIHSHNKYGQDGGYIAPQEGDQWQRSGAPHHQQGAGGVSPNQQRNVDKYAYHDYVNLEDLPTEPHKHHPGQPDRAYVEQQANAQQWPSDQHPDVKQWQSEQNPGAMQPQQPSVQPGVVASTSAPGSDAMPNPNLGIGSRIQIATKNTPNEPFKYGVIRWIGEVSQIQGPVAGIELDDYMEGCTDGTLLSTGQKFFTCLEGRGMYYPLVNLQPDMRFVDPSMVMENLENPLRDIPLRVIEDQFTEGRPEQIQRYIGEGKGIQGHQNSCYLDASVFGLFALTDAFDEMFLKAMSTSTADQSRKEIAEQLWKGIVNPLRKNGIVRYESVMALRNKLDELGEMEGIAHAEKDPEEFLNMLFKHTLKVDPFLMIRRPYGDEPEFFVQLFLEFNEKVQLPTIGQLLHTMFLEQKLSFTQMPSKLLIQVPRFGRQFKTYEKIIPDLKLSITDLIEEYIQSAPRCFVCNDRAIYSCEGCAIEFQKAVQLCVECDKRFHAHPGRANHGRQNVATASDHIGVSLDLLSVICIETSHYVCFTKQPSDDPNNAHKWIFFDSMANRVYDRFNIPSVTECSDLLNKWVYPANGDLSLLRNTPPRELPEYVRRFTQDVYLCVYVNLDSILYG